MRSIFQDTNATGNMSFISPVFILAFIFSGLLYAGTTVGINEILKIHNNNIADGTTSEETADAINLAKRINMLFWLFSFVGCIVWSKNHSTMENTAVDVAILFGSIGGMYISGFITMLLLLMGGMLMDTTTAVMNVQSGINISATSFAQSIGLVDTTKKIAFAACFLPVFLGVTLFLFNCVKRTTGTTYTEYQYAGVD